MLSTPNAREISLLKSENPKMKVELEISQMEEIETFYCKTIS
jgi:hypothetical protein